MAVIKTQWGNLLGFLFFDIFDNRSAEGGNFGMSPKHSLREFDSPHSCISTKQYKRKISLFPE